MSTDIAKCPQGNKKRTHLRATALHHVTSVGVEKISVAIPKRCGYVVKNIYSYNKRI